MAAYAFAPPPMPSGTQEQKLQAIYSYLYRMNESLAVALNNLGMEDTGAQKGSQVHASDGDAQGTQLQDEYEALRSLVVKTAHTVRSQMDEIETRLDGKYLAIADFGQYRQNVESRIRATAEGVLQEYGFTSKLDDLSGSADMFTEYMVTTGQYIKTGLLYFDGSVPRYGVAVGEHLTTTVVDGQETISRANLCATFTSDKLSFWMGGAEVAYVNNNRLYIANAEVSGQLLMGNWRVSRENGFTIQWIGG